MAERQRELTEEHATPPASRRLPPGKPMVIPRFPDSPHYSIADLERETGFPNRTIRFYVSQGMLTPAHGRGPTATYDKDHLLRLKLIRELKNEFQPLETIKQELSKLSTSDLEAHFAITSQPVEASWRRVTVRPDLEVHIRERDVRDYEFERAVGQIIQHARIVLENLGDAT